MYTEKQRSQILLILLLGMGAFIIYASKGILIGVLWAVILYSISRPVHVYLSEKKKLNNTLSTLLILLGILILLVTPIFVFSSMLFRKISDYSKDPKLVELINSTKQLATQYLPEPEQAQDLINSAEKYALSLLSDFLGGTLNSLLQLVVMYLLLFFMLNNRRVFEKSIVKYLPFHRNHSQKLFKELQQTTLTNLVGQGFIALVQGTLVTVGFLIFGLSDAVFWGIICVFLGFIPLIGAPLVFVPAGLIALSGGDQFAGIGIMLWGFILVVNIDNVIRIFISKWVSNEHPLIILMGVLIGIPLFGLMGLVIGPLLLSWFLLMVKIYEEQKAGETAMGEDHVSS